MGVNTRIYDRFEFWSVADCDCTLCQFYGGKNRPCLLDSCCCADIREEALRREQEAAGGPQAAVEAGAVPCRG